MLCMTRGIIPTHAQEESELCFRSSSEFQSYLDFSYDMVRILNTAPKIQKKAPQIPLNRGGLFSNNILELAKAPAVITNDILKMGAKDVQNTTSALLAGTYTTIANLWTFWAKDIRLELAILFMKKPFARDMSKLKELGFKQQDMTFDLIMNWRFLTEPLEPAMREKILASTQKYVGTDKFFKEISIGKATTYSDIIELLYNLNSYMKTFISTPWRGEQYFFNYIREKQSTLQNKEGGLSVILNETGIANMTAKYNMIRKGPACNNALKTARKNLKKAGGIAKDFHESKQLIQKDTKRLQEKLKSSGKKVSSFFNANKKNKNYQSDEQLTARQKELLYSVYGIDATKITKAQGIGLADLFKTSRNMRVRGTDKIRNIMQQQKKDFANTSIAGIIRQMTKASKEELGDAKKIKDIKTLFDTMKYTPDSKEQQDLRTRFNTTLEKTLIEHEKMNLIVQNNEIYSITTKFTQLHSILDALTKRIWTKNTPNSINTTLKNICEKQCANKGNKFCQWSL